MVEPMVRRTSGNMWRRCTPNDAESWTRRLPVNGRRLPLSRGALDGAPHERHICSPFILLTEAYHPDVNYSGLRAAGIRPSCGLRPHDDDPNSRPILLDHDAALYALGPKIPLHTRVLSCSKKTEAEYVNHFSRACDLAVFKTLMHLSHSIQRGIDLIPLKCPALDPRSVLALREGLHLQHANWTLSEIFASRCNVRWGILVGV
mmetsp:Transcript_58480/g.79737  ORF Transcript_58480/g.79737 Transcript_58480/m.79737 type:complete len:204 (+) Transcript_58480:1528-2139(+)